MSKRKIRVSKRRNKRARIKTKAEHEKDMSSARCGAALSKHRAETWTRTPSKKKRSRNHCRKKDPRKGGFSST